MSCSSSGLRISALHRATRVRSSRTTRRKTGPIAQWIERQATDLEAGGSSPPGIASGCVHVDSSRRCSTTFAMTGARSPCIWVAIWDRRGFQNHALQRSIRWRPAHVVSVSWTADDHDFAATRGSGRRSHKPCGVRFKSARCDDLTGCSSGVERVFREHEDAGAIPVTPTSWRAVHRGGDSDFTCRLRRVRVPSSLRRRLVSTAVVQSLDKRPTKVRSLHETRSRRLLCSGLHARLWSWRSGIITR